MTRSTDAAAEELWPSGAPVISDCWNGYSPSSSVSSQPCSPGACSGGPVCHAGKSLGELVAMPSSTQESFFRNKRMRLHLEMGAGACVQGYSSECAATSTQPACSVTPSPHVCGAGSLLPASEGIARFCAQLSTVYVGGSAPCSADQNTQRATDGSLPDLFTNILFNLAQPDMLQGGNGGTTSLVQQQVSSLPAWQPQQLQELQPLAQLQQQLAQMVSEQPAHPCSTTAINSLALTLALCDMGAASTQLAAATSLPPAGAQHQACVTAGGNPAVGSFSLPFVFTGAVPVHAPAPPAPLQPPLLPPPAVSSLQPLPCNLPSLLLESSLLASAVTQSGVVGMTGFPGAFDALGAAAAAAAAVVASQLPPAALPLPPLQPHPAPPLPPLAAAAIPQLHTPCFNSYPSHTMRCTAPGADPRVVPQPRAQPPPQLKVRHSQPRRLRPPSPLPPSLPPTPPQPGSLGPEDWILHVVKVLGMSEPDTARLALHCWRRVAGLPQLHHAARLWSSAVAGRNLYATACLWVSIKLEEKRRAAPGGVVLAHLAATTPAALGSAELAVMNWLEWRPYDGYRLDESHLLVYM